MKNEEGDERVSVCILGGGDIEVVISLLEVRDVIRCGRLYQVNDSDCVETVRIVICYYWTEEIRYC